MGLRVGTLFSISGTEPIIKFFRDTGAQIGTGCRVSVSDSHEDGDEATISLREQGDEHRRIGLGDVKSEHTLTESASHQ